LGELPKADNSKTMEFKKKNFKTKETVYATNNFEIESTIIIVTIRDNNE
jgi:hypothetical protein